jgi:hypothetical protein
MPTRNPHLPLLALLACSVALWGCASPYRSDQGALVGGLGGAGLGAIVGNAVGHPGAGAAIGAGVGAVSGAAVGGALDDIEARNRAEIAARLGHPAPTGAVTVADVIGMSRAGVPEEVIITHIRNHGVAAPVQAGDLITLQQNGVTTRIVQAMQAPPVAVPQGVVVPGPYAAPPPYWGPYPYPYPYPYYYRPWGPPRAAWGVTIAG